nr:pre-toxin TG domain-containing protein [Thiothrix unzii]
MSKALADLALGMTPGIGWAKDVYEASLGKSLVTGKDLDASDRVFATLGVASAGTLSKTKTILNAIKKLSNGDKSFIAIALNIRKLTNGIVSPITFRHIVFGNFKHTTDTGKYIITGGLHTKAGLDQFLNLNKGIGHNYNIIEVLNFTNPTIQTGADILQKTYNNGVIALQLPRTAFNAKSYNSVDGFKGVKTLWPDNFSIEDYVNALKQALESETGISAIARSKSTPDLPIEIKEVYLKNSNKINYVVRIKKGELETFYPELNQQ